MSTGAVHPTRIEVSELNDNLIRLVGTPGAYEATKVISVVAIPIPTAFTAATVNL